MLDIGLSLMGAAVGRSAAAGLVNLVANGGFDDSSAWTLEFETSIAGGKLVFASGVGTAAQDVALTEGLFYQTDLTLSAVSGGSAYAKVGAGPNGIERTANGVYSEFLQAGATQQFLITGTGEASVDDVSLTGPITTALNVELCPDPGFDDAGAWTIGGTGSASVTGGQLVATGGIGNRTATCSPEGYPLNTGTYETAFTIVARTAGTVRIDVCGVVGTGRNAVGTYTEQVVVSDAAAQTIVVRMLTSPNLTVDNVSVKKVA